jgi:SNF2 family DNA or RNA helicase
VDSVDITRDDSRFEFRSSVESEYGNEVYNTAFTVDVEKNRVTGSYCTCPDFHNNSAKNSNFLCKHLVATAIKGVDKLEAIELSNKENSSLVPDEEENLFTPLEPDKKLLSLFTKNSEEAEVLNLEVSLTIEPNKSIAEFKIGSGKKSYIIKNIKEFSSSRLNGDPLPFSTKFTYDPSIHYFDSVDEKIVDYIEGYGGNLPHYTLSSADKRYIQINHSSLKSFLSLLRKKDFVLNYEKEVYSPNVYSDVIPLDVELSKSDASVVLSTSEELPLPLTPKGDVVFSAGDLYLLDSEKSTKYMGIYKVLSNNNRIEFEKKDVHEVLNKVLPELQSISDDIYVDDKIKENISSTFKTEFYFDIYKAQIVCEPKFVYEDFEYKFIVPDRQKENEIKNKLLEYLFDPGKDRFVFTGNDDDMFYFLDVGLDELRKYGTVFYSDKFKNRKIYKSESIKAIVDDKLGTYLDFSFNISDIDPKEFSNIMYAFKDSRTYYKLKDGSFMDLREGKTQDFLEFVENIGIDSKDGKYRIPNSRAMYMEKYIKDKNLDLIEGREIIDNISNGFKNAENIDLSLPQNLNADLRAYQVSGFNWFQVLDNYKFGGILADEMGLGKTLQTITFLLAHLGKKSIIITPTSVIYNWKSEFEKFAPDMKVMIVHGSKDERKHALSELESYDVVLTTYGTYKNDVKLYKEIEFDYCIIDEAQNIKNPHSLASKSVKAINAKCRFALTGTPIENNLVELWSIFDFVMPGYLYNKKKFQNIYLKKEANLYNLKLMIKPFILRRTKKEVMTELPDKIEKNYIVELNREERSMYSNYAKYVQQELLERDLKTDKIVVFSYMTKLRQLCLDPSIVVKDYHVQSSKISTCIQLIEEGIENNHKILLFSQFTTVLKKLGTELKKHDVTFSYIDGATKAKDRLNLVEEFNNSDTNHVFLISLKAGGIGLNLTSADTVIHFDPWWNPSVENQATDRAHRFGQKNTVQVIKLIAKGTIEEKILKLQESKKELISTIMDGNLSNENLLKELSDEEILSLFS